MSPFGTLSWKPRSDLAPIKTGAAYAVDTAVNAVLNVADGILLTHFAGNAANGTYQAAARLNQSVPIAFSVLTSFFLPRLGGAPTPLQFRQHSRRFLYLTGGAWLLIAALFGAAWILYRSFPPQSPLRAAAPLLPGLAAIALIRFLCGWMSTLLIARNMQRYKTAAYGAALVLIVISSAFSIEAFGSLGIVISYGMGFAVCFAAMAPATFKAYTYNRAL
jgi:O-antigen/teichoic acid export membrane protein